MFSLLISTILVAALADPVQYRITPEGEELAELINDYRESLGLSRIPLSPAMMTVGQWHVDNTWHAIDVSRDWYDSSLFHCNLHTWWDEPATASFFSQCCYTSDHAQAACMWDKPQEITTGWDSSYTSAGFEIAASGFMSNAGALTGWQGSTSHNDVMVNTGIWANYVYNALGCGSDETKKLYFCWFGFDSDNNPYNGPNENLPTTTTTTSTSSTTTTTTSTTTTTTTEAAPVPVCCHGRRNRYDGECSVQWHDNGEPGPNQNRDLCNNYLNNNNELCCYWDSACS